jgi:hypothetical protein
MLHATRRAFVAGLAMLLLITTACDGTAMEILSYTSPIRPAAEGVITVRARASTSCEVTFEYAGTPSEPAALPAAQTDSTGFVSWRWRFAQTTAAQEVKVIARCSRGGEAQEDEKTIVVER